MKTIKEKVNSILKLFVIGLEAENGFKIKTEFTGVEEITDEIIEEITESINYIIE